MGFFDIFKKKKEENREAVNKPRDINMLEDIYPFFGSLPDGTEYALMDFQVIENFRHRDGSHTQAIIAKIQQVGRDGTIIPDYADYISFEMPLGLTANSAVCQKLIEGYFMTKGTRGKSQTFIGKLTEQDSGEILRDRGSDAVANYMEQTAAQMITDRRSELDRRHQIQMEKEQIYRAEQRKQFEAQQKLYEAERRKTIQERLSHPYFSKIPSYDNFEQYDGINLSTGDILRLRNVQKIGKAGGTYLYTGFMKNTPNEHDVDYFGEDNIPDGYPITFETDLRLEDIAASEDLQQINQILSLLATDTKKLSSLTLSYIGKLSKDGIITREQQSRNPVISNRIEQLKQEFRQKLMRKNDGR